MPQAGLREGGGGLWRGLLSSPAAKYWPEDDPEARATIVMDEYVEGASDHLPMMCEQNRVNCRARAAPRPW